MQSITTAERYVEWTLRTKKNFQSSNPSHVSPKKQNPQWLAIFREIASNTLIHREYLNPFPAKLIIERGQVLTENSNKPHGYGPINPANFSPYPKNPVIARFFREIGRADELGSGMRKLKKYGKAYGGSDPEMIEGDIFRIIVKCPDFETSPAEKVAGREHTLTVAPTVTPTVAPTVGTLLALLQNNGECSSMDIRQALGLKDRSHIHNSYLQPALVAGYIEMTLSEKPNSRLQKYRLTEKGFNILQSLELKYMKALDVEAKVL